MLATSRPRLRRTVVAVLAFTGALTVVAAGLVGVGGPTATAAPLGPQPAAGCPTLPAGATLTRSVDVRGVERTYRMHIPTTYTGRERVPLVLAYHGRAERGATFESYTGLSSLPAIVVYPDGLRGPDNAFAWQGAPYSSPRADDIAFTRAILRSVRTSACVDRNRTYAVGRSNGAGLVAMLACRMPSEFSAYATISAAVYTDSLAGCGARPVSLVDFHGTADGVIHYDGGVRFGAPYLSSAQWLRTWTSRAGCGDIPVTAAVNSVVDRVSWPVCAGAGPQVVHYRIRGGTHRWPGSAGNPAEGGASDTISATRLLWQFFASSPHAST
ncbi:PHB depolymerase family esterase [Gordonia sp. OPL2]|uniref:alpha/beta hydrolase family esterase n=1 Tax=Gordonia sp. OPL2 TaxID=2486274 RepID=UPI0021CCC8EB|nr:PHB depolymerase family esterase [Gordonia sp. OPL2]